MQWTLLLKQHGEILWAWEGLAFRFRLWWQWNNSTFVSHRPFWGLIGPLEMNCFIASASTCTPTPNLPPLALARAEFCPKSCVLLYKCSLLVHICLQRGLNLPERPWPGFLLGLVKHLEACAGPCCERPYWDSSWHVCWGAAAPAARWHWRVALGSSFVHQTPAHPVPPSLALVLPAQPARALKQPSLKLFLCLEMSSWLVHVPEGQGGCVVSGYQGQHHSPAQPDCGGDGTRDRAHTSGAGAGEWAQPHHKITRLRLFPLHCI